ncbi:MAG: porin family protein [Pseudolabrys sp.]
MRRLSLVLTAAVSVIAFSQTATAAPVPVPVPTYSWTGFYVGGHAGYGWADKQWTLVTSSIPLTCAQVMAFGYNCQNSHSPDGFLGGVQAGYNWQFGQWVIGVEGQWSWTDWRDSSALSMDGTDRFYTEVNWVATAAGRLGWAIDHALIYVKGGGAWVREKHWLADLGGEYMNAPAATRSGWMFGVGGEYALWDNWSVKLEYDYMDFGSKTSTLFDITGSGYWESYDIDQTIQVIMIGLNYRFGAGNSTVPR